MKILLWKYLSRGSKGWVPRLEDAPDRLGLKEHSEAKDLKAQRGCLVWEDSLETNPTLPCNHRLRPFNRTQHPAASLEKARVFVPLRL